MQKILTPENSNEAQPSLTRPPKCPAVGAT
jgi:hypothetical protein